MVEVNEGTSMIVEASFFDEDGVATIPASVSYRVDDVYSRTEMVGDTLVTPATVVDIDIPTTANAIVDTTNKDEPRQITVTFTYGVGKGGTKVYEYTLKNLLFSP